ncbi:hypothetical protein ACIBP4_22980 [Micromonospora maritima]|uniref:Uncharacterized protein n=1 Tax=Micromonospora maritima TaxID=986711 RepID=A0ABW7ZQN9_9ACTN
MEPSGATATDDLGGIGVLFAVAGVVALYSVVSGEPLPSSR